eukprot:CAMPEP_0201723616 /NCGR_PEP_ID=MMETSP0593-20130828/7608_1 /ASSEMBLY_ACC=CAM_ASM_000672 /TAXON_ID=267983 /ORGANISM="Skeletonema japonicum, Strain CCMP2506" /LENGTH=508 /DNA_ID=CAMNT_0048214745 /DNA_START=44 /DNA_END=1570 /DNA_ORIENTATION=+
MMNNKEESAALHTAPPTKSRSVDDFYNTAYEEGTNRWQFWLIFLSLGIANSGDATEISCMNYILSHPLFKEEILQKGTLEDDYGGRGAAIASSIFAGMLIGGIVTGAYGDRLGRRPTLLAGLFLNATSGIAASMASSAVIMCECRFFAGLGIGAVLSSLITLASELSPAKHRGWYITIVGGFWTLGSVFIALLAFILFGRSNISWRVFVLIAASPTLLGGILVYAFVPESPRYLALHGRYQDAADVANHVAEAMGFRGKQLTVGEIRDHYGHLTEEKDYLIQKNNNAMKKIRNLYGKNLLLNTTLPLQIVWFSMSFGSGLCTWITKLFEEIGLSDIYLQSLYFALANIPGNALATVLVDRVGRKVLLFGSMTSAALCLALAAHGASDAEARQLQVILSSCAFHSFLVTGWCALSVMTSELFPTSIRGTGMGVCSGVGRIAGILVQYVNGAFIDQPLVLLLAAATCMMTGAFAPIVCKLEDMTDKHLFEIPIKAMGVVEGDGQAVHKIV